MLISGAHVIFCSSFSADSFNFGPHDDQNTLQEETTADMHISMIMTRNKFQVISSPSKDSGG